MGDSSIVLSDEDNLNPLFDDMDEQESFLDKMRELEFVSCGSKPPKVLCSKPNTIRESDDVQLIRSFQEDNPQIETVFIESDEEDRKANFPEESAPSATPIKNLDIKVNTPLRSYTRNKTPFIEPLIKITTSNGKYSPPKIASPPNLGNLLPLRQILPGETSTGLLKNSQIIALEQNDVGGTSTKKFLLIPNDVAPILAKSQGPITFNVPGLGPVVISHPSDLMKAKTAIQLQSRMEPPKKHTVPKIPQYDALCDLKYSCWRYIRNRKRDLEGFSINDRLGFNGTEVRRGKCCVLKCKELIAQLEQQLPLEMRCKEGKIKIVNIEKLKNKPKRQKLLLKRKSPPSSPPLISSSEHSESENSLLVTKKVVVLNRSEQKRRGRKRKRALEPKREVKREKMTQVRKMGTPKKPNYLDIVKPCSVQLRNDKIMEKALEKYYGNPGGAGELQRTCHIIDNLKQLKEKLDPQKPLIILDEENYTEINFQKVANKFNIVFSMGEKKNFTNINIRKREFVNSVKTYNVKFVKSRILCDYLFSKDRRF